MIEADAHHILHDRIAWEARPEGQSLRDKIIARDMLRGFHERLHRDTSVVPVPLYPSLQFLSRRFRPTEKHDVFDRIDQFTELLDKANEMKHVKPIEIEVNLLCMDALEAQVPYLVEGLRNSTIIDLGEYRGRKTEERPEQEA